LKGTLLLRCYGLSGAHSKNATPDIAASLVIVDFDAVADSQAVLSTKPPDCVLHKAGEVTWIIATKFSGVDSSRNS
jgi:hypothetical protein